MANDTKTPAPDKTPAVAAPPVPAKINAPAVKTPAPVAPPTVRVHPPKKK